MKKQLHTKLAQGFSLVELLVVIAVIAVIAAIAIPNISDITGGARDAKDRRNAQNIASVASAARAAGSVVTNVAQLTNGITNTNLGTNVVFRVDGIGADTGYTNYLDANLQYTGN